MTDAAEDVEQQVLRRYFEWKKTAVLVHPNIQPPAPVAREEYDELFRCLTRLTDRIEALEARPVDPYLRSLTRLTDRIEALEKANHPETVAYPSDLGPSGIDDPKRMRARSYD